LSTEGDRREGPSVQQQHEISSPRGFKLQYGAPQRNKNCRKHKVHLVHLVFATIFVYHWGLGQDIRQNNNHILERPQRCIWDDSKSIWDDSKSIWDDSKSHHPIHPSSTMVDQTASLNTNIGVLIAAIDSLTAAVHGKFVSTRLYLYCDTHNSN
jgi:hypothetical protein